MTSPGAVIETQGIGGALQGAAVGLRVTGAEGVKEFIRAELGL